MQSWSEANWYCSQGSWRKFKCADDWSVNCGSQTMSKRTWETLWLSRVKLLQRRTTSTPMTKFATRKTNTRSRSLGWLVLVYMREKVRRLWSTELRRLGLNGGKKFPLVLRCAWSRALNRPGCPWFRSMNLLLILFVVSEVMVFVFQHCLPAVQWLVSEQYELLTFLKKSNTTV